MAHDDGELGTTRMNLVVRDRFSGLGEGHGVVNLTRLWMRWRIGKRAHRGGIWARRQLREMARFGEDGGVGGVVVGSW